MRDGWRESIAIERAGKANRVIVKKFLSASLPHSPGVGPLMFHASCSLLVLVGSRLCGPWMFQGSDLRVFFNLVKIIKRETLPEPSAEVSFYPDRQDFERSGIRAPYSPSFRVAYHHKPTGVIRLPAVIDPSFPPALRLLYGHKLLHSVGASEASLSGLMLDESGWPTLNDHIVEEISASLGLRLE